MQSEQQQVKRCMFVTFVTPRGLRGNFNWEISAKNWPTKNNRGEKDSRTRESTHSTAGELQ